MYESISSGYVYTPLIGSGNPRFWSVQELNKIVEAIIIPSSKNWSKQAQAFADALHVENSIEYICRNAGEEVALDFLNKNFMNMKIGSIPAHS